MATSIATFQAILKFCVTKTFLNIKCLSTLIAGHVLLLSQLDLSGFSSITCPVYFSSINYQHNYTFYIIYYQHNYTFSALVV